MQVTIHTVAFERDDKDMVHGILVKGYGRDRKPDSFACCGQPATRERGLAVRDGNPITCEPCLKALASGDLIWRASVSA